MSSSPKFVKFFTFLEVRIIDSHGAFTIIIFLGKRLHNGAVETQNKATFLNSFS